MPATPPRRLLRGYLITHGESGRSGVGRTRNVVAPRAADCPVISSALVALPIYLPSGTMTRPPVSSAVYNLFEQAMTSRKQILCTYHGRARELCPIILGHSQGREKALTYQFGGQSEKGLPPGGQWRCLWLSKVRNIRFRDGPWHAGDRHDQPQGCVEIVDLDVNPASPYSPRRRL
jgi:hypothetical protein